MKINLGRFYIKGDINIAEEYDNNKTLFNFLIPTSLKKSFDLVCRYKTSSKSQTLNNLIRNYVLET